MHAEPPERPVEAILLPAEAETTPVPVHGPGASLPPTLVDRNNGGRDVVAAYLQRRSAHTADAYGRDLMVLARFLAGYGVVPPPPGPGFDEPTATKVADFLLARTAGEANQIALKYLHWMRTVKAPDGRTLAGATIDRRLSALKSLIRCGRILGRIHWTIEVPGVGVRGTTKTRETRGPGLDGVRKLYAALERRHEQALRLAQAHPHRAGEAEIKTLAVLRDRAILSLLYAMALRRFEVAGILLGDLNVAGKALRVRRKGDGGQSRVLTVPDKVMEHLLRWIREARAGQPAGAPVFVALNSMEIGTTRLTEKSVWAIVVSLGKAAGLKTWPHGLRHAAITDALDRTNGNVREVARFSGHRSIEAVMRYDDDRRDTQGDIANKVANGL